MQKARTVLNGIRPVSLLPQSVHLETFADAKAHRNFELSRRDARRGAPFYLTLRRQRGARAGAEEALIDDGGLLITLPQVPGHVEAKDKLPPRSK